MRYLKYVGKYIGKYVGISLVIITALSLQGCIPLLGFAAGTAIKYAVGGVLIP